MKAKQALLPLIASLALFAGSGEGFAATDLATRTPDEITALQRRLSDAGCYHSAVNGTANAATARSKLRHDLYFSPSLISQ